MCCTVHGLTSIDSLSHRKCKELQNDWSKVKIGIDNITISEIADEDVETM